MTAAYHSSRDRKSRSRQSRRCAPYRLQLEPLEERLLLATYVVNSIGDEPDSNVADALCDNGTGLCTLRAAIDQANATANVGGVPDEIHFDISGSGVHTISPSSALPPINDPVTINGYTQPKNDGTGQLASENTNGPGLGINAVPLIELDGSAASGASGLVILAGNSTVRGLVINRFQGVGIRLASDDNVIAGNFIGTSAAGDADFGNGSSGVEITDNIGPIVDASNNTIGGTLPADRNLISGNNTNGVHIAAQGSDVTGNQVLGNLIGTNKAGTAAIGNNIGVRLEAISGGRVTGNLIGGTTAAARNVISGNAGSANILASGSQVPGNRIQGNFIGTDVTGTVGLAGATNGVNLSTGSSNNLIGGDDAADGVVDGIVRAANVISGNPGRGVLIDGGSSANQVKGNRIGTNAAGTAAIPNGSDGVQLAGAAGNFVGGATAGAGNLISGNSQLGVALRSGSTNNVVQGNRIGTDATGANPLPNGSDGVSVFEGSSNNLIGGDDAADGVVDGIVRAANVIASNLLGVHIGGFSTGNSILGNSIFSNSQLGIDLGGGDVVGDGVTENDGVPPCPAGQPDCDPGPNNLQNFPVLTSAVTTAGVTTITGTLNSTPSSSFRIEFFSNTAADPSLHGEGQTFVGTPQQPVQTDAVGNATFSFSPLSPLATGLFISATATKLEDTDQDPQTPLAPTDTSEFSTDVCSADQFTVVNTNDSGDGSLRQAILNANGHSNALNPGGAPDLISFCILGSGVHTISPTSALPAIDDPVIIDGYTQPGASANTLAVGNNAVLLIELDGTSGSGSAFLVNSPNNTFKGLVINRFPGASGDAGWGFRLLSAGNTIQGCYLGTNPAGDTALPNRGGGVSVEATSQPPNTPSGNNIIGGATAAARNLILGGTQGFAIDINGINAAVFQGGIIGGDGNTVQGNYIGTNAAGSAMLGRSGIQVFTKNNIIGGTTTEARNVMFSNGGIGLNLSESKASGNTIQGNFIGINATGTASLGGNSTGVNLLRAPNNTIGGTAAGAGNVISGNAASGINADETDGLTIQGNLIGTNAAGTAAVPNNVGIVVGGSNNTIGGTTAGARNVISGNNSIGLRFNTSSTTAGNLIQGNYIGTDITGMAALGNGNAAAGGSGGIQVFAQFTEPTGVNTIGGTTAGAGNIISANHDDGISLSSANILVQGNYIGTDVTGAADLGNGGNGVTIQHNNNTIGGTLPGAGNIIAFNGKNNVGTLNSNGVIVFSTGNAILGNSIFSNGRLGIDLVGGTENASGVTANDTGDGDTGSNNLQNFPVLESASIASGNLIVSGFARPGSLIEFFIADDGQATFGEGKTFLTRLTEGSAADTDGGTGTYGPGQVNGLSQGTDDTNRFSFTISVAGLPAPVMAGTVLTATATDASNNTSEFSGNVTVQGASNPPTVTLSPGNPLSANEGTTQTYNFSINDPDGDNIASVTVSCGANGTQVGVATFTDTTGSFQCSFPDGPASSTVSASATDSRGATGAADMQTVTVNNVAPTVVLSAANELSVDEGTTHTYNFSISDPGVDTITGVTVSCGANGTQVGSATFTNTSGSFQCNFPDGPSSSTVSASATDSDGDTGAAATQTVTIANVPPTVVLSATNDLSVNESAIATHTYNFTIGDPGNDTVTGVTVSCGANGTQVGTATFNNTSGSFVCSFPDGPASSTVSASATDSDGDTGAAATQTVTIANVPPTVVLSAGNDLSVNESGTATHTYNFAISDPGNDTVTGVTVSCGANGTQVGTATFNNTSGSFVCGFPDGPASSTVSASATDSDGDTGAAATQTVTIANVPPTVVLSASNDLSVSAGTTHTYNFTISDPGVDTITGVTVSCGANGTQVGSATFTNTSGSFQCDFPDGPASSTVSASATDSDGDTGAAATQTVTVTVAPVNDRPTASDSSANTVEEMSVLIDLGALVNDLETADGNLTYTIVSGPSSGMLTGSGSSRTYVPNTNFNGMDSFTYSVTDRGNPDNCAPVGPACAAPLTSATRTISITVGPVNDTPSASNGSANTVQDSSTGVAIDLAALVSDVETADANLTYAIVAGPSSGMLSGNGASRTYIPNAGFNGIDSFSYSVTDRGDPDNCGPAGPNCSAPLTSAIRTVTITVASPIVGCRAALGTPPAPAGSGNVNASVAAGRLVIQGDAAGNDVQVKSGAAPGSFIVTGRGDTHVNDHAGPELFTGVTRGMQIRTGLGDDTVVFDGSGTPLNIPGGLNIRTDGGADTVWLDPLEVDGRTAIKTGTENDSVTIIDAILSDRLRLQTGSGDDELAMCSSEVEGRVRAKTKLGTDSVAIDDSMFGSAMLVATGNGNDRIQLERRSNAASPTSVFRDRVRLKTKQGSDLIEIGVAAQAGNSAQFQDCVKISGGGSTDTLDAGLGTDPNGNGNSFDCGPSTHGIEVQVS